MQVLLRTLLAVRWQRDLSQELPHLRNLPLHQVIRTQVSILGPTNELRHFRRNRSINTPTTLTHSRPDLTVLPTTPTVTPRDFRA
jgi:hypothetical protein